MIDEGVKVWLNNPKLVHIYLCLNETFVSKKNESVIVGNTLTIEHIMPREWVPNWPLPDGSKGMEFIEMLGVTENNSRVIGSRAREGVINTLGNLTVLSSSLNTAQSNLGSEKKRPEMMKHSLLPINQTLASLDAWDETQIHSRGEELFERAVQIWTR